MTVKTTLPVDSTERKNLPVLSGALRYAPASFMLMAETAKLGNDKHNPGQALHHARGRSSDHGDCIVRHTMDIQDIVAAFERNLGLEFERDALRQLQVELGQLSWRANIMVQELAERYLGAPLAPGAKVPVPEPKPGSVKVICGDMKGFRICLEAPGHDGSHKDDGGFAWASADSPGMGRG